jgi:uncharacterized protein (DUF1501 family)
MTSRRIFLKSSGFALVSLGFAPSFLARTALAAGSPRRAKQLIAIFQRGAVDGLSMVVPYGDADYYRSRPAIAIPRPGAAEAAGLDLDSFFAFNPRLAPLEALWKRGDLAIVHACGSPDATRSHFDAQDYMETATPGVKSTADGWLNRYLQARTADETSAFRAVALTAQLPRTLQGTAPALAMSGIQTFGIRNGMSESFEAQYAQAADRILNGVGRDAFDAMKTLRATDPSRYQPEHGADYPPSPFGQALKQIAQLTKAGVGLEVAFAEVGGWDTHVNQGATQGQLAARLDDFAWSIAALIVDLGERMGDVVVLTMSEFGRAVAENGNRGTDHGHGNAMLVVGGGVRGGRVYGRWPGLAVHDRYEGRDLAITTDFRDVFAEIVTRHLGLTSTGRVFPGYVTDPRRYPGLFAA